MTPLIITQEATAKAEAKAGAMDIARIDTDHSLKANQDQTKIVPIVAVPTLPSDARPLAKNAFTVIKKGHFHNITRANSMEDHLPNPDTTIDSHTGISMT